MQAIPAFSVHLRNRGPVIQIHGRDGPVTGNLSIRSMNPQLHTQKITRHGEGSPVSPVSPRRHPPPPATQARMLRAPPNNTQLSNQNKRRRGILSDGDFLSLSCSFTCTCHCSATTLQAKDRESLPKITLSTSALSSLGEPGLTLKHPQRSISQSSRAQFLHPLRTSLGSRCPLKDVEPENATCSNDHGLAHVPWNRRGRDDIMHVESAGNASARRGSRPSARDLIGYG